MAASLILIIESRIIKVHSGACLEDLITLLDARRCLLLALRVLIVRARTVHRSAHARRWCHRILLACGGQCQIDIVLLTSLKLLGQNLLCCIRGTILLLLLLKLLNLLEL